MADAKVHEDDGNRKVGGTLEGTNGHGCVGELPWRFTEMKTSSPFAAHLFSS